MKERKKGPKEKPIHTSAADTTLNESFAHRGVLKVNRRRELITERA